MNSDNHSEPNVGKGAATQAILQTLTLETVFAEVLAHAAHMPFSQSDLEQVRRLFGLRPRCPDNVIKFRPRARVAPTNGGNAA